jgi:hypothetical protein
MRRRIAPDELSYLFQRIGQAVWHLQYVEEALSYFYFIKGILVTGALRFLMMVEDVVVD